MVMQLLGTAPEIVFDRSYPAEYRWASYFDRMAAQMTAVFDADHDRGVTPFFFGDQPAWGPVPFETEIVDIGSLRAPILRALWSAWSMEVLDRHPRARFYAEKLATSIDPLVAARLDVRVIDLVRDPRDTLASIRAFTAIRGAGGFGRPECDVDELAYLDTFIERFGTQLKVMEATPAGVDRILLRYEDLIADLDGCAVQLGSWLGVDLGAGQVRAARNDYLHHMTSPSEAVSVGRWEQDLESAEADRITAALGPALVAFGYDLAPSRIERR